MTLTPLQTERLLIEDYRFTQLGFSMLLTRLKTFYAKNPSEESLHTAMVEINTFIHKFKGIMKNDYTIITNL